MSAINNFQGKCVLLFLFSIWSSLTVVLVLVKVSLHYLNVVHYDFSALSKSKIDMSS